MIAKYPGTCCVCKTATRANVDIYDIEAKKNYHEACLHSVDLFSKSEAETTAAQCRFINVTEIEAGHYPAEWFQLKQEVLP